MLSKLKLIALLLIGILATVGVVYAASIIWSNTITINPVNPSIASLILSINTTTPVVNETIRCICTLSTGATGVTINFLINNVTTGAAVTSSGIATWDYVVPNDTQFKVNATCTI